MSTVPFRIVITGEAHPAFIATLTNKALDLTPEHGGCTLMVGDHCLADEELHGQ